MTTTDHPPRPARRRPRVSPGWLLAVPLLALLWPPLYDRTEPRVFGVPFFYAYQLAFVPVSAGIMLAVHLARRPRR